MRVLGQYLPAVGLTLGPDGGGRVREGQGQHACVEMHTGINVGPHGVKRGAT